METHVCEDVHTELILSSCYGFHQADSMLDTESIQRLLRRNAVWHAELSELDRLKRSPEMFIPSGFPSDTEKTEKLSPAVKNSKSLFICSSQGKDLKLLVFWIKEPLQPVRVGEICKGSVSTQKQ